MMGQLPLQRKCRSPRPRRGAASGTSMNSPLSSWTVGARVANGQIEFILNRFPAAVGDIVELGGNGATKLTNAYATVRTGSDGQASATLVATRPGDTDITAFAPGIADAGVHKVFGVVHWVDGCPDFPGDADNPAGTPHRCL